MLQIRVPATTANLGPGFDSLGLALQRYLTVSILEPTADWVVDHDFGDAVPHDANNLVVATALQVAPDLAPHHIRVGSDIPFARGLGSSSAALAAGIELADLLGKLGLSADEKLAIGVPLEGHPDNIAPAILGGAVAAYYDGDTTYVESFNVPELVASVFIPDRELLTADARAALPATMDFHEAVAASATANALIAAFSNANYATIGRLLEADRFHEGARSHLVPELARIREVAHAHDIWGTYLSGAGPTILTLTTAQAAQTLLAELAGLDLPGELTLLAIDRQGTVVTEI
jgi:homoserine kinase